MIYTSVKQKVGQRIGRKWSQGELARRAGVHRVAATYELNCTGDEHCRARHTPQVQEALAKAVGLSVGQLFGKHAWFRLAAKNLKKHERRCA